MSQALLLGRPLRMPADDDDEAVTFTTVDVYLSPKQATWMGGDPAATCPGCCLFEGGCALHGEPGAEPT